MDSNNILKKLLRQEDQEADALLIHVMVIITIVLTLVWAVLMNGVIRVNTNLIGLVYPVVITVYALSCLICKFVTYKKQWNKYLMLTIIVLSVLVLNIINGYKQWMFYALPIFLSCRYFNTWLTVYTGTMAALGTLVSAFTNAYWSGFFGYPDLNTVGYSKAVTILTGEHNSLFIPVLAAGFDKKITLYNTLILSTSGNLVCIFLMVLVALSVVRCCRNMLNELERETAAERDLERKLEDQQVKMMISQIQPHFLYNSLSAISGIEGNPDKTVDAIGDFGKYLRENLSILNSDNVIPFSKELDHIRHYVALEKLRYEERLQVIYDLETENFRVPLFTVQMLVENAIKHGVSKQPEGGSVHVYAKELPEEYVVIVEDDGVGFDPSIPVTTEHVGIANIRLRLKEFCGGNMEILSHPGEGTKATIHIPKTEGAAL